MPIYPAAANPSNPKTTARILAFPPRGPFAVYVERVEACWLVICRSHGWLHSDRREAISEAEDIARGFAVAVEVRP